MDAKLGGTLAQLAYTPNGQIDMGLAIPAGWRDAGGTGYDSSGGAYRVFINDTTKEVCIAFKGSTGLNDWVSDLTNSGRSVVEQILPSAQRTLDGLAQTYGDYTISTVGHSLGGAEAQTLALTKDIDVYVFDSLPVSSTTLDKLATDRGLTTDEVLSQYRENHTAISTNLSGEIATLNYRTLGGETYLDPTPTTVSSNVTAQSLGLLALGLGVGAPVLGLLGSLGASGNGHRMGNLKAKLKGSETFDLQRI